MTEQSTRKIDTSETSTRRGMNPTTKLALLVIPLLIITTGWIFWQQLQQSPERSAGVEIPPYGVVVVRLTTDPFPAQTPGVVQMTLRLQSSGSGMIRVDQVTYSYGPVAGDEIFQSQAEAVGMETFQGPLRFTSVGDWWIKVRVENQGTSDTATFTIPVKPAL